MTQIFRPSPLILSVALLLPISPATHAGIWNEQRYDHNLHAGQSSDFLILSSPFFLSSPLPDAMTGTAKLFFQNTDMTADNNYSPFGAPTSINDVRITRTSSPSLRVTAGTLTVESLNVDNGNSFTISNGTGTATNSTIKLGNPSGFTNAFSGTSDDLIYLTNNSSLTIQGPNASFGTGTLSVALMSSGNFNVGTASSLTISSVISGASKSITKTGGGIATLTGANTYTGATTVAAGTLLVTNTSGSGTGSGTVSVSNSGTVLAGGTTNGAGGISGSVTINSGAAISPGTSGSGAGTTAILNTGALTLNSGSLFKVDFNSATVGTGYDRLAVTGAVAIGGSILNVTLGSGFTPTTQTFVIIVNDLVDPVVGAFSPSSVIPAGYVIDYVYDAGTGNLAGGNDIALVAAVPEPSTWIGAALALAAIGVMGRKRLRQKAEKLKS
jgi:autotransporter-associated beta strand protein